MKLSNIKYLFLLSILGGCVTTQQMLDNHQDVAIQTVLSRARFDMNCPKAQGSVLSRQAVAPVIERPEYRGIERFEYTVGVKGCGQRNSYVVVCNGGGDGCIALDGQHNSTG